MNANNVCSQHCDWQNVLRCLFCLGLLARYGANMIDSMNDKETNVEQLLSLFKHYLLSDDFDVKARSLQVYYRFTFSYFDVEDGNT